MTSPSPNTKRRSKLQRMIDDAQSAGLVVTRVVDKGYGQYDLITSSPQNHAQEQSANIIDLEMRKAFSKG